VLVARESRLGFQGDPFDDDTGLYDLGTRLFDPALGRFTTRDALFGEPMAPVSLNRFVSGAGDPVSNIDLDGLCAMPDICGPTSQSASGRKTQARIARTAVRSQSSSASQYTYYNKVTYTNYSAAIKKYTPPKPRPPKPPARAHISFDRTAFIDRLSRWGGTAGLLHTALEGAGNAAIRQTPASRGVVGGLAQLVRSAGFRRLGRGINAVNATASFLEHRSGGDSSGRAAVRAGAELVGNAGGAAVAGAVCAGLVACGVATVALATAGTIVVGGLAALLTLPPKRATNLGVQPARSYTFHGLSFDWFCNRPGVYSATGC